MIISRVFEKAIDEPSFGDTYADLCVRLSKNVNPDSFVHIIEERKKDCPTYYRWSSNMGTTDSEVFGPFASEEECMDVAFIEDSEAPKPTQRGEMELILVKPIIVEGIFLKVMRTQQQEQSSEEAEPAPKMFVVFFPVEDAESCGQLLSEPFESEEECRKDSRKWNSSKRSLLNKCEEEFKKQDIYVDWKKEKKEYEAKKESMAEAERNETEEALEMKRIKIKKQMLGNIRFIGELFKKRLIKEKIMHECIQSLMKLTKKLDGGLEQAQDDEMDEEDHEALCQLFNTIGEEIDRSSKHGPMELYFDRIEALSNDKSLASRSRFMYKDLIELRQNGWQTRRKQETAKTLDEIRKDAEREESLALQQQQQARDTFRVSDRRDTLNRPGYVDARSSDARRSSTSQPMVRGQQYPRQTQATFDSSKRFYQQKSDGQADAYTQILARKPSATSSKPITSEPKVVRPEPLAEEVLKARVKGIRNHYLQNPTDEEELLSTVHELSGTFSYEAKLILWNCEWSLENSATQRFGVTQMLLFLLKRQKVSQSHFEAAFTDLIEFVDDMKIDIPKIYENMGELLSALLIANGLNLSWLCREFEKIPNEESRAKMIEQIMKEIEKTNGRSAVVSCFSPHELALVTLLGEGKWGSIKTY
jgi:translation initiation factor 4G